MRVALAYILHFKIGRVNTTSINSEDEGDDEDEDEDDRDNRFGHSKYLKQDRFL